MLLSHLLVGAYSLAAALTIVAFWSFLPKKEKSEFGSAARKSHLAAELFTAVVLALGGAGLILSVYRASLTAAVGLGMLGYAVLNIIGKYLGERNRNIMVALCAEEFLTLVAALALLSGL